MLASRLALSPHRQDGDALAIDRRTQQALLLSAVTGVLVGLAVLAVERSAVEGLLGSVLDQPLYVVALAPGVGLLVAAASLRWVGGGVSGATSDEYVRAFHDPGDEGPGARPVLGRVLAGIATVGYGGSLSLEGPSVYVGSVVGSAVQRRFARSFSREDAKLLLVAGAAAGLAAIFKAPATGALFAIEVPYRADVARRNVLPAMVAAATSYVTFAVVDGTEPILPVGGTPGFGWKDIGAALVLGLLCGAGGRLFSAAIRFLRGPTVAAVPLPTRIGAAAAVLALLAWSSDVVLDAPLTLGSGDDVVGWATDPGNGTRLVLLLLVLRVVATLATFGGGGVGGLFVPLVVSGALMGRLVGDAFGMADTTLLIVVGMAAFLGAGYRTPLAGVVFVAETTASPAFMVPALLATAAAQLLLSDSSVAQHQRAGRLGHLERRFQLPISAVMSTDVHTVPPDATIEEFLSVHLVGRRRRSVPVVDDVNRYLGLAVLDEVVAVRREAWATTDVRTIARTSAPRARTTWLVRDAVTAMERADTDVLAVVDGEDRFVGMVTTDEVLQLDEILERTGVV
ncbi:MAG TPA: chloride channel protein [Acidimicrobiales bacterium]|nr:chloride channel protein [Acidimicrobiales bacterium]